LGQIVFYVETLGLFFSILKGERVCFPCVLTHQSLRLLFRRVAEYYLGILATNANPRSLKTPVLKAPFSSKGFRKSQTFVSFEEARDEGVKIHVSEEKMHEYVFDIQTDDFETCEWKRLYMLRSASEDNNLESRIIDDPVLGILSGWKTSRGRLRLGMLPVFRSWM
jgi:hypothetical protein